jgi:hypothetical protein
MPQNLPVSTVTITVSGVPQERHEEHLDGSKSEIRTIKNLPNTQLLKIG